MALPDVSIVESEEISTILEESASVEIIADAVEVAKFDIDNEAMTLLEVGIQGPAGAGVEGDTALYELRSDVVSHNLIYRADAPLGTADDSAPIWRIRRIQISYIGDTVSTLTAWAQGSRSFISTWNERLNYLYS